MKGSTRISSTEELAFDTATGTNPPTASEGVPEFLRTPKANLESRMVCARSAPISIS